MQPNAKRPTVRRAKATRAVVSIEQALATASLKQEAKMLRQERKALRGQYELGQRRGVVDASGRQRSALDDIIDAINSAASRGSPALRAIATAVCLPAVSPPVRGAVGVSGRPTAVATPFGRFQAVLTTAVGAVADAAGNGDSLTVFAFRQFSRKLVMQVMANNMTWTENAVFLNGAVSTDVTNSVFFPIHHLSVVAGNSPSGQTKLAMVAPDGNHCVWLDAPQAVGSSTVVSFASGGFTAATQITARKYVGEQYTEFTIAAGPGTPIGVTIPSSGYWAFALNNADGSLEVPAFLITISILTIMGAGAPGPGMANNFAWAHIQTPGFGANVASFETGRETAVSLMLSNYSTELTKRGRIVGYTAGEGSDWESLVAPNGIFTGVLASPYSGISALQNSTELSAVDGMYGFLLPVDMEALRFQPLQEEAFGTPGLVRLEPLIPTDGFLCICADVPLVTAGAPAVASIGDRTFVVTVASHFEGTTGDPWRQTDFGHIPPSAYLDDFDLIKTLPCFHSNRFHLGEIMRKISNVAGWAAPILSTIGLVGGPAGPAFSAAGQVASNVNRLGNALLGPPRRKRG